MVAQSHCVVTRATRRPRTMLLPCQEPLGSTQQIPICPRAGLAAQPKLRGAVLAQSPPDCRRANAARSRTANGTARCQKSRRRKISIRFWSQRFLVEDDAAAQSSPAKLTSSYALDYCPSPVHLPTNSRQFSSRLRVFGDSPRGFRPPVIELVHDHRRAPSAKAAALFFTLPTL